MGGGAERLVEIHDPTLPPHFDTANFPEQEKRMITRQQITKGCAGSLTILVRMLTANAGTTMCYQRLMC